MLAKLPPETQVEEWPLAAKEGPWRVDPAHWYKLPWPEADVLAAYELVQPLPAMEMVYLLVRPDMDGKVRLQFVVTGDSALQRRVTLKKDEDFWKKVWKALNPWRTPPTPEEEQAIWNRGIHYF